MPSPSAAFPCLREFTVCIFSLECLLALSSNVLYVAINLLFVAWVEIALGVWLTEFSEVCCPSSADVFRVLQIPIINDEMRMFTTGITHLFAEELMEEFPVRGVSFHNLAVFLCSEFSCSLLCCLLSCFLVHLHGISGPLRGSLGFPACFHRQCAFLLYLQLVNPFSGMMFPGPGLFGWKCFINT